MLEKNLKAIEQYNPVLANNIRNHQIQKEFSFTQAQSQDYILVYNNEPYHSLEDPQKEAEETFNSIENNTQKAITIVFGLGIGYLFKRVFLSSKSRIILYEPNLDILRITLEAVDFEAELSEQNRVFVINKKADFGPILKKLYLSEDPINIAFSSGYKERYASELESFLYDLGVIKGTLDNNYLTLFDKSHEWLETGLKNIPEIKKSTYIDCLKNKFEGKPAFILSPGPSLNNNIDQLAAAQDKGVIFCTGGALRLANKHNINVDFATFIDTSERTAPQLDSVENTDQMNFILQPSTYPLFYESPAKRRFVYLPQNEIFSNWLARTLNINNKDVNNYGTVSMTCVTTAIQMGCNPIIILGQDLALTKEGTLYADSGIKTEYIKEDLTVKGHNGETLPSNSTFIMFKGYFEEVASKHKDRIRFINASESGALIDHFEHMPLSKVIEELSDEPFNTEDIISNSESSYINPIKGGHLKLSQAFQSTLKALDTLVTNINKSKVLVNKINKELTRKNININYVKKMQQQQQTVNTKIDKLLHNDANLIMTYVQKEAFDFQQGIGRFKRFDNAENIKLFNELVTNYYDAILTNIPELKKHIEKALR